MRFKRRIHLENGAMIGIPHEGRGIYIPSKETQERIKAIKNRKRSTLSWPERELIVHQRRELLDKGVCPAGSKLIDNIFSFMSKKAEAKELQRVHSVQG